MENLKEIVIALLKKYQFDYNKVCDHYEELKQKGITSASSVNTFRGLVRKYASDYQRDIKDNELIETNVKIAKQKQKAQDINRIERKSFREQARRDNALEELSRELITLLEKNYLIKTTKRHKKNKNDNTGFGVVHLTDIHGNSLVIPTDSISNEFNFDILSKRLKKLALESIDFFKVKKYKTIAILGTGDFLNASTKLDQIVSQAGNRAKGVLHLTLLLKQFIQDFIDAGFDIIFGSVAGNESRVNPYEYGYEETIVSDNFDLIIENFLRIMFKNCDNIQFVDGSYTEKVVSINDYNILLIHGDKLKQSSLEKELDVKTSKYAIEKNIVIDYTLLGHIHSTYIHNRFSRGASMKGTDPYSDGLNFISKASQNILFINPITKQTNTMMIDLQNVDGIVGYDIEDDLIAYNQGKSNKKTTTIFKVVI